MSRRVDADEVELHYAQEISLGSPPRDPADLTWTLLDGPRVVVSSDPREYLVMNPWPDENAVPADLRRAMSGRYQDLVRDLALRWTGLACWRRQRRPIGVELQAAGCHGAPPGCLGAAFHDMDAMVVFLTGRAEVDLATVLHELAHLDMPCGGHPAPWKRRFAAALREVRGGSLVYDATEGEGWEERVHESNLDHCAEVTMLAWVREHLPEALR